MRKRVVVVCPGRGSYTKDTLGYIKNHPKRPDEFIKQIDSWRQSLNEPTISELDSAETFKASLHTKGEHASPLIYSAAYADFMAIHRERYEIVAICGNSMGWYLTLAFGGALDRSGAFNVIQTMGSMMKAGVVGGQIIYPVVGEDWRRDPERVDLVHAALKNVNQKGIGQAHISIWLGGYIVIGGDSQALKELMHTLPKSGDYPFQLINHAAFHTPLLHETSEQALNVLPPSLFYAPQVPLIDGRGHIWQPYATDTEALWRYTLGHQVYAPYDFTTSVTVALKEFAPDHLVLLGPGNSLGGALGQILIQNDWHGLKDKASFQARQKANPIVLSMGLAEQREVLVF